MTELLPCPFCGSDELSHGWSSPGFNAECSASVECNNCNTYVLGYGEAEAIAAWNTRVISVPELFSELKLAGEELAANRDALFAGETVRGDPATLSASIQPEMDRLDAQLARIDAALCKARGES